MSYGRGGPSKKPGLTDPRQGKARGETYGRSLASGAKGIVIIVTGVIVIGVVIGLLTAQSPEIRSGSWIGAAVVLIGYMTYRRIQARRRPRIEDILSDLNEQ